MNFHIRPQTNYEIENFFFSGKIKFANVMNNDDFQTIIKQNNYDEHFNPNQN